MKHGRLLPVNKNIVVTYGSGLLKNRLCQDDREVLHMQFKDLEWKDVVSDGLTVCSHSEINLCGWIKIEFKINHDPKEDKYMLYAFGKGSIRRLVPEKYESIESAKNAAYRIYSNEIARIKKAVDFLMAT